LLVTGLRENADAWAAVVRFKQVSGTWLLQNRPEVHWQKGFDVRFIPADGSAEAARDYVRNNPVRAGLVQAWQDYPFTGEISWRDWRGRRAADTL
jgi:hypothetical protein